jgi:hypothetical protein
MRDTHRQHHSIEESRGDHRTPPSLLGLLPEIGKKNTNKQPTATQLETGRPITSPDASDVRNHKKPPKSNPEKPAILLATQAPYSIESKINALQTQAHCDTQKAKRRTMGRSETLLHSLHNETPATHKGGGTPIASKRSAAEAWTRSSHSHTISELTKLLNSCTDEQYAQVIRQLPENWSALNEKGTSVTKRQLEMAHWGAYKDDHSVLTFQQTILQTRQHPNTVTQYDTLLAQSIVEQNDVWIRQITNPLTGEQLQHPLQNPITIMQIYNSQHYTTLITDNHRYYYYDGLGLPIPRTVTHLHKHIRQWYGNSMLPPALQPMTPTVHTPHTPQQTDGWSCAMHMLLTSLSAIYQGHVPVLQYGQRHVDQLSRAHLRYVPYLPGK